MYQKATATKWRYEKIDWTKETEVKDTDTRD